MSKKVIPVTVTMPPEMAEAARVLGALEGKSRSALVREALDEVLTRHRFRLAEEVLANRGPIPEGEE